LKKGGTGERAETGIILEIIFPTTNCVEICLLEKKGNAKGGGYARQRRAVRVVQVHYRRNYGISKWISKVF